MSLDGYFESPGSHVGGAIPINYDNHSSLGPELLRSDSGELSLATHSTGSSSGHSPASTTSSTSAPAPSLVTSSSSSLQIELVWDKSVSSAPSGFESAVISAVSGLVADITTSAKTILYLSVGWGEIAGTALASNALGESESYGYLTNYSTVTSALAKHGDTFSASNEPIGSQFFVTSSEAKAIGLISGTSGSTTALDGYIGFSTLSGTAYSWNYGATGTTSSQYNLQAVAAHEMTEIMGRIGTEGTSKYNGKSTDSPLDLFNFKSFNTLELNGNGGYFSNNDGKTGLGTFNNSTKYGGDIADWASATSPTQSGTVSLGQEDAFNAFDWPGYNGVVSPADLEVMASLGFGLTSAGKAIA
jgi:hypothetical protein